jgi:plastocyanin
MTRGRLVSLALASLASAVAVGQAGVPNRHADAIGTGEAAARAGRLGAAPATGAIAGRVEVQHPLAARHHRPDPVDPSSARGPGGPDRRRSVVYLETAPLRAFEERHRARARIDQRHEQFVPRLLAITVGTVVDFPNNDAIYHNVFSLSKPRRFDLGRYAAGRSRSVRFDRPGIVRVFCDIHSHMSAFILVFNHPFFAVTDDEGWYRIDGVPTGTYTVTAWYEGVLQQSRPVTISRAGGTVDLHFSLRR